MSDDQILLVVWCVVMSGLGGYLWLRHPPRKQPDHRFLLIDVDRWERIRRSLGATLRR